MAEGGSNEKTPEALTLNTQLTNVRDITKCSRCQQQLKDPKTLQCLHSFCTQCMNGLEKSEKDSATGYECPQCQRFTQEKDVRVYQFIVQLLDAPQAKKGTPKVAKCERCNVRDAKWFCVKCKKFSWHCDECKRTHDDYVEEHKTFSLEEMKEANYEVDAPVICFEHKLNEIELYCVECDKVMCQRCKLYNHDGHKWEPIKQALNRVIPQITTFVGMIKRNIKVKQDLIKETEKEKEEAIERYNKKIRENENDVCEQSQVIAWVTTVAAKTKRASQLQHLQDGLIEKIHFASLNESLIHSTRRWPWAVKTEQLKLNKTIALPMSQGHVPYTRIAILWDRIWMINHNTGNVYKYTFDGNADGEFKLDAKIIKPLTAIQVYSGAVIAAKSGLFSINRDGELVKTIKEGDISDVCLGSVGTMYALEPIQGRITRFQLGTTWQKQEEIQLEKYEQYNSHSDFNFANTLLVKDGTIYVGIVNSHRVLRYDMSGRNVREMANKASGLSFPSLSGIDNANSILISNRDNRHRFDMMDAAGNITALLAAKCPWFAVFQDETTLWCLDNNTQLKKFVQA